MSPIACFKDIAYQQTGESNVAMNPSLPVHADDEAEPQRAVFILSISIILLACNLSHPGFYDIFESRLCMSQFAVQFYAIKFIYSSERR